MSPYRPVNTKTDFARRFAAGEFGNRTMVWPSLQAYLVDDYAGLVHLRNRVAGGHTWYKCTRNHRAEGRPILDAYHEALGLGYVDAQLYIGQMIPTKVEESLRIQGEVMDSPGGLYLFYSTVPLPMRDSLKLGGTSAVGLAANMLLRRHLCPNSQEWVRELLDRYPGHVVEFSTYAVDFGCLPRYNTVFWEVRNY